MRDPIRIKKTNIFVEAKMTQEGREELYKFNALLPDEEWKGVPEVEQRKFLLRELGNVSPTPVSGIYNTGSSFSYVDPNFLNDFDYANVLVEVHIPYCIDIPNGYEFEVLLSKETGEKALVIPSKIWTQKAKTDTETSDFTDFFADDRVLYFKKSTIIGAKIPRDPSEGWEENFTGINIQSIKDTTGKFRFTHLLVQFELPTTEEELSNELTREAKLDKAKDITFQVVNKLIDAYRFITKQEHITRLGRIDINMIYFVPLNLGFYSSRVNIETSVMNRSKNEIEKIEKMLEVGETPNLYQLLLLDAENSLNNKNYPMAVVQSFQALEIFLENYLIAGLQTKRGYTEKQAIDYVSKDNNWRTPIRLKAILKEVSGYSVPEKNIILWNDWLAKYNNVRNMVVHKGKEATEEEVKETLKNNEKVISLVKSLE